MAIKILHVYLRALVIVDSRAKISNPHFLQARSIYMCRIWLDMFMSVYSDIVGIHCLFLLHMKYVPHTHRSQTESDKGIAVLTTMGDVETSLSQ